jgi:hypothetical protein
MFSIFYYNFDKIKKILMYLEHEFYKMPNSRLWLVILTFYFYIFYLLILEM